MDQLIATYLFTSKQCPLPGIGNLAIGNKAAENNFSDRKIIAPYPVIHFDKVEVISDNFIKFISDQKGVTTADADLKLQQFSAQITSQLKTDVPFQLPGIGNFFVTSAGSIQFQEDKLPAYYLPDVAAERVIHPQAEHAILVGDKESTNTEMADFFNEEEPVKKSQWWIWAILLLCLATIMLLTYFTSSNDTSMFGNSIGIF